MRTLVLSLLLLFSTSAFAQRRSVWQRVYTFDESVIEMDTGRIVKTAAGVGHATFRWSFDQPQTYSADPRIKYKTRVERIEFKCSENRFRTYDAKLLDDAGKVVRHESMERLAVWSDTRSSAVMSTLAGSACNLISSPKVTSKLEAPETRKVLNLARAFVVDLERAKDFRAVQKYFSRDYVDGYLKDKNKNWFTNLEPDTIAKSSRADLQAYYVELMNLSYLGLLYSVSGPHPLLHLFTEPDGDVAPPELLDLIKRHPYSLKLRKSEDNFDYLARKIDNVQDLRSFTDLLQQIDAYFLQYLNSHPRDLRGVMRKFEGPARGLEETVCSKECLGLAKGTRLWEIDVPVFHLQIAEIEGRMQIVSARPFF